MKADLANQLLAWWHSLPVSQIVLAREHQALLDELWAVYPTQPIAGVFDAERDLLAAAWKRVLRALPEGSAGVLAKAAQQQGRKRKAKKAKRHGSHDNGKCLPVDVGLPWQRVRDALKKGTRSRELEVAIGSLMRTQQSNRWLAARLLDGLMNAEFGAGTFKDWGTALKVGDTAGSFPIKALEQFIKGRKKPTPSAASKIGEFAARMLAVISDASAPEVQPLPESTPIHQRASSPVQGATAPTRPTSGSGTKQSEAFLSLAEIEARHGIKKSTLRAAVHRGELKCHRFTPGRTTPIKIHTTDLEAYLRNVTSKRQRAAPPKHLR
ncbi:MAG: hypothetical protein ICCCNLDF_03631 [Planctomycetes bacterium]|nr:hypothetical protein [Planctomycetota bacterium]